MIRKLIITGLGTGFLPIAPGTWGSAGAVGVFLLSAWFLPQPATWGVMALVVALGTVGCVALGGFAETAFGRKDPSQVTLDEWAGQALSLVLVPYRHDVGSIFSVAIMAFVAFRLFDITKPPPARGIQRVPKGWGIVLDDLIAGAYANLVVQVTLVGLQKWGS